MSLEDLLRSSGEKAPVEALPPDARPIARTLPGKIIKGGEWTLGGLADFTSKHLLIPIAQHLTDDPLVQMRLEALKGPTEHPVFAGQVASEMGLFQPEPGENIASAVGKGVGRFGLDVFGDPLTYVPFGALTKAGKIEKAVTAAKEAGQTIKLDSKVAEAAAELQGKARPSAQVIKDVPTSMEGLPLPEQIRAGKRSLVSIGTESHNIPVPIVGTGPVAAALATPFSAINRIALANRFGKAARQLFSSKVGNPEFDNLVEQYRDLAMYRAGEKVMDAKALNTTLDNLTRELGMPREVLNKTVTNLVERETAGLPGRAVGKVVGTVGKLIPKKEPPISVEEHLGPHDLAGIAFRSEELSPDTKVPDVINKLRSYYTPEGSRRLAQELDNQLAGMYTFYPPEETGTNLLPNGDLDLGEFGYFHKEVLDHYRGAVDKLRKGESITSLSEPEADAIRSLNFGSPRPLKSISDVGTPLEHILGDISNDPSKIVQAGQYKSLVKNLDEELSKQFPSETVKNRIASDEIKDLKTSISYGKKTLRDPEAKEWVYSKEGNRSKLVPLTPETRASMEQALAENQAKLEKLLPPKEYTSPQLHLDQVDPKIAAVARNISESQQRQLVDEMSSGVRIVPITADRDYAPHITTPEAISQMRNAAIAEGRLPKRIVTKEMDSKLMNAARREFTSIKPDVIDQWVTEGIINSRKANALKGKNGLEHLDSMLDGGTISEEMYAQALHSLSIEEVNQIASTRGLKSLGTKEFKLGADGKRHPVYNTVDEFFHTDPVYHQGIRGIRGEKARTSAEFYQELKDRGIAVPRDDAPVHYVPVKQPELEGFKFEPAIASALNKWYEFVHAPKEPNAFLKLFDTVNNAWKAWTLAIFPSYHTRNMVGNFWNNYLAGVINPEVYLKADALRLGKDVSIKDAFGKVWHSKELLEEAKKLGVIDRGWYGGDIAETIAQELQSGSFKTLGKKNSIVQQGFKVGKWLENNARVAHFLDRLKKGDTSAQAALSVKKYLFDYGDLSDFEKSVLKRVFPFYTWTRKNIPLQLQHLIMQPAKFSVIYKARAEAERPTADYEAKYLPQWMMENFPTRIRYNKKDNTYEYFLLNSWLPAADVTKIFNLHEVAANMLNPIPKEVIQQAFNYDFFLKKKIQDISGQKEKFLGVDLPARAVHAAKIIRALTEVDKMTKEDQSLFSKINGFLFGKTYTVDPEKALLQNKIEVGDQIDAIKRAIIKESRKAHPDPKELQRLNTLIQEAAQQY